MPHTRRFPWAIPSIFLYVISLLLPAARANNEIFPPDPAAQNAVSWKDGYFIINGKPTFISSGSIHYARVPRELWRDRIWRLKMMGFNCVQTYVFWNASEPKEGQFDFSDNNDLDAWLSLLHEMGMYALVRVGPYSCAEWENGGYPAWFTVRGDISRKMGPWVASSDAYLKKIHEIVAQHQVNHGGSVILVQEENEHASGWGTDAIDPYLKHLDDLARAQGIEVPMFNSGLHHGNEPAGETPFPPDPSPWYSTEFWTVYFNFYGEMPPGKLAEKIRGTWKIIAFGGGGYNYYVAHGGTNFGYSGDTLGTSYDYAAPVGEAGQLRKFYFAARRAAYFAQSFNDLLAGSHNDANLARSDSPDVRVTARTNPTQGSFVMGDTFARPAGGSRGSQARITEASQTPDIDTRLTIGALKVPTQGLLKVASLEPRTVLVNLPWTANATFASVCTNVLLRHTIGNLDYWVCYGPAGDAGEITLKRKATSDLPAQVTFTYPDDQTVKEIAVDSGDGKQAMLLVMNTAMTDHTWLANEKLFVGPSFVLDDNRMEFAPEGGHATIYSADGKSEKTQPPIAMPKLPALTQWSWRDAAPERAVDYPVIGWSQSKGPIAMESYDGYENRYGWYRTVLHRDVAGPLSIHFGSQNNALAVFLNGQLRAPDKLDAKAGDNALAFLVKAAPRPKGPVGSRSGIFSSLRGLSGGVSLDPAPTALTVEWKRCTNPTQYASIDEVAKTGSNSPTWEPFDASQKQTLTAGKFWFRGTFTLNADQVNCILDVPTVSKAKTVLYFNGHRRDDRFLSGPKMLLAGQNTFVLQVQAVGESVADLSVSLWHDSALSQVTWYFHPGLEDLDETQVIGRVTNWDDFLSHRSWQTVASTLADLPTFWKGRFDWHKVPNALQTVGLDTAGLKAGHVWLNGHNLGESPQNCPLYTPECWLKDGDNDLVVFDLYGSKPDGLQLSRYEAFAVAKP